MLIGVPKEVKTHEYRVGLSPGSVREIVHHGHEVVVEAGAGTGIAFEDASYEAVGARILPNKTEVFAAAELIVKVKEPQPQEAAALREGQVLFTYLHLAADKVLAQALVRSGAIAIAYETVTDARGGLPLLAPMSEVAGRMAVQVGPTAWKRSRAASACFSAGFRASPLRRW
jgi:alanine dehydrogenase